MGSALIEEAGTLAKGLGTTFKHLFRPTVTEQYPEERWPLFPRFRARHVLRRYENGLERCVGCSLCAAVCPARAIYVEPGENSEEERHSPGERYARRYEINMIRCIYCGLCEEACPTEAIVLRHEYEFSARSREEFIYTKEKLLETTPS